MSAAYIICELYAPGPYRPHHEYETYATQECIKYMYMYHICVIGALNRSPSFGLVDTYAIRFCHLNLNLNLPLVSYQIIYLG